MKYFVVSLHRSGTLSITKYFNSQGIRAKHWPVEHEGVDLETEVVGHETDHSHVVNVLSPVLESFDAFADVPIPVLYRELFSRYPHSKFIFLYRSAFDWMRSVREHYKKSGKNPEFRPFVRVVYWKYFDWRPRRLDQLSDAELIWMHGQHLADVISYFLVSAPKSLALFDLYSPDLNVRIQRFIGSKAPLPFPHLNLRRRIRRAK